MVPPVVTVVVVVAVIYRRAVVVVMVMGKRMIRIPIQFLDPGQTQGYV